MFCLSLDKIEYWIHYKPLFKAMSFRLNAGDCCYLHGQNGVGKSTLLHIILGILPHHAGRITWPSSLAKHPLAHDLMGYMGHAPGINLRLTVAENIALWHALYQCCHKTIQHSSQHTINFNLDKYQHIYVANLSAGQQKRLAWVRLLMQHKKIWLLDESFTHLDTDAMQIVIQCINQHTKQGGALIYTSHQAVAGLLNNHRSITMDFYHD